MRRHQQSQLNGKRLAQTSLLIFLVLIICYFSYNNVKPTFSYTKDHSKSKQSSAINPETHFTTYKQKIQPILEQYCYDCHMAGSEKGSLDLDQFTSFTSMTQDRESWGKIKQHLELKLMPPVDETQPTAIEKSLITDWIANTIFYTDPVTPDPGKVVLRRLNRNEYKNTIYDLLGVKINTENILPLDDTGYGFDTIANVHTVSSAHIEKYLTAAETALLKATAIGDMPWKTKDFSINTLRYKPSKIKAGYFYINGTAQIPLKGIKPGIYELEFTASSTPAGKDEVMVEIRDNHKVLAKVEIPHNKLETTTKIKVKITKESNLSIAYINDFWDPNAKDKSKQDRNFLLHKVRINGPLNGKRPSKPTTHKNLFPDKPSSQSAEDYALKTWLKFANIAFRRKVAMHEIKKYSQFLNPTQTSTAQLQRQILLGMQAMLTSPKFLYIKSTPENTRKAISQLSEFALASRLSYFIWSSTPDKALLQKAKNNQLRATLTEEINRMLDDQKSNRFIRNFSGQWLQLRDLNVTSPNRRIFPNWSKQLKKDAISETQHFIKNLLHSNASLLDCLDADYSFLNQRIAKAYGIKDIKGSHFRKVIFPKHTAKNSPNRNRGGLLTQIAILTLTSYPDRTSPVLRGKWILENILGTAPPPPPGDIPSLEGGNKQHHNFSFRQQLERHRKKAECAACHNLLDPLGFTLENYNAIGQWRDQDKGKAIDSFGKLISGESFKNGKEMKSVLRKNKADDFLHCISEKLLTYSLGRGLEYYDKPALDKIITKTKRNNLTLRSLIHAICNSTPFQMTRTPAYKASK